VTHNEQLVFPMSLGCIIGALLTSVHVKSEEHLDCVRTPSSSQRCKALTMMQSSMKVRSLEFVTML